MISFDDRKALQFLNEYSSMYRILKSAVQAFIKV